MFKYSKVVAAAGVAALTMSVGAPTIAQNAYEDVVNAQLDSAAQLARQEGFSSTHSRYSGSLDQGESRTVTLDLDAGTSYMIIAPCDQDCSDIDLWLYDENGNLIDEDVLPDDLPIVQVTPIRDARFSLRTRMIRCSVEPCFYGIGVFGQR